LVLVLTALYFSAVFCRRGEAAETPSAAKIKEVLQQCVDKQRRAPGIVTGLVDKNGITIVAWGRRDDDKSDEVNGDTIFEIGSITKVFTSLLLQDMANHGELQLDDPITNFLPASVTVPSRNGRQITLRSLATHTSGLPRLPENLSPTNEDNPYADYTVDQMYAFLSSYKLTRNVGAKSEYSNFGMGLLGHILALKAGTNYEALVVNRICSPLKMDSTRITLIPQLQAHYAPGHNEAGARVGNWDLPTLAGAGALRSSANDLLKLLVAEMGLAPSALSNAMQKTETPQKSSGFLSEIGLGWQIDTDVIWHNGGTGGYRSYMGFKKDKSLGVVVLANSANDVDDIGQYLLGDRDDVDATPKRRVAKIDYSVYDRYAGKYQCSWSPESFFIITRESDRLMAKLADQPTIEVFPESETDFFYTVVDAQLTFVTNKTGTVTHLMLHQNGADLKAEKVSKDSPLPIKPRTVAKIDYGVYDRYVGKYECSWSPDSFFIVTREGNKLMAKLADQPAFEVFPESKTEFFYKVVDAQLTFVANETGTVTHLMLHQNGANLKADKMK
jgi:CubicO group peptidase (beta-lactamase class C family)